MELVIVWGTSGTESSVAYLVEHHTYQWRIQDFPQEGAPTPKNLLFSWFFAENCMKMKEFGPPGGGARVPGAPP